MIEYGNRGMDLEEKLENLHKEYKYTEKAVVQKIPTPVKVLNMAGGKIRNGYYAEKSTVDYLGTYQGRAIAFEAKETSVETRFDLSNMKDHQFYFLDHWQNQGAISFVIVSFTSLNEIYYMPFELLDKYWMQMEAGGRKSIPYSEIAKEEYELGNDVDYIDIIERMIADE